MASVRKRGNVWHIQWFDPVEKKVTSQSTGLTATESNYKKAEKYAKSLQSELTHRNKELKQIGVQRVTIKDAFDHFLRNNQSKHPKTIKNYNAFYKLFTECYNEHDSCSTINKINVEAFIGILKEKSWQINTVHTYVTHCIHFLNFLFEYNYTTMFKINRDVKTHPEKKEIIVFNDQDISKMFKQLQTKNTNFQTLIYLLFYMGIRPSDILTIVAEKISIDNQKLSYYSPKRKMFREVAFHKDLIPVLQKRIDEIGNGHIVNYKSVDNVGKAVNRFLAELKINNKNYSARTFRKTFITLCRSKFNMDASIVMELVGHQHGNITDSYYNLISIETMKNELKKFKRPDK